MEPELTDENLKNLLLKLTDSYKNATKHFIQFLTVNNIPISYKGIKAYIQYLKNPKSNYTPNTYNLYLATVKNRVNFLLKFTPSYFSGSELAGIQQLLSELKYEKIKTVKKTGTLSIPEIKKLIAAADPCPGLMIRFLLLTGMLVSEMVKIRYIDIKQDKTYSYITIPGRKKREIQIETPFMYTIAKHFNGNTFLFEDKNGKAFRREMISMSIKRIARRVLLKEISANTLRKTFAALIIRKTGKIKAVSEYLGHKSINSVIDMFTQEKLNSTDLDLKV
ncbi:MAG: site-specific integrase [Spirochaetales bacterium]|nr:site-specific integrase [Spirochaetales bacterium]